MKATVGKGKNSQALRKDRMRGRQCVQGRVESKEDSGMDLRCG